MNFSGKCESKIEQIKCFVAKTPYSAYKATIIPEAIMILRRGFRQNTVLTGNGNWDSVLSGFIFPED